MFSLKNKSVSGSGIGQAIAKIFANHGASVHILDINYSDAYATAKAITDDLGEAFAFDCDVSNQNHVKQVLDTIKQVDILVNCAGIAHIGKADTTSEDDFDRIYRVNVKGTYNCLHEVLPLFVSQNSGVILNISSIAPT